MIADRYVHITQQAPLPATLLKYLIWHISTAEQELMYMVQTCTIIKVSAKGLREFTLQRVLVTIFRHCSVPEQGPIDMR